MSEPQQGYRLHRREVVAQIMAHSDETLVIAGLGSSAWDAAAAGDRATIFHLWGAMGGAAMIGLGLALAQPDRQVLVITGDGEVLMGLGSLATIAVQSPPNLAIAVLDNDRYGETGMQHSHTRYGVDLAGVARAAGFRRSVTVRERQEVAELIPALHSPQGPTLAAIKVAAERNPPVLPPRDGVYLKTRFREAL